MRLSNLLITSHELSRLWPSLQIGSWSRSHETTIRLSCGSVSHGSSSSWFQAIRIAQSEPSIGSRKEPSKVKVARKVTIIHCIATGRLEGYSRLGWMESCLSGTCLVIRLSTDRVLTLRFGAQSLLARICISHAGMVLSSWCESRKKALSIRGSSCELRASVCL